MAIRTCFSILVLVLIVGPMPLRAASPGPAEQVRQAVDEIIAILQDKRIDRAERQAKIGEIINNRFDFHTMSQRILATHWRKATPAEKSRFVTFFSQYLENTYMGALESYTGETVTYQGERVKGDRAVVDTNIVTDDKRIPVNYKLRQNDGEWFAYDVEIEGVSLINNYRNLYAAILKTEGMDGLLADLERKLGAYKRSRQTPEAPR